MQIQRSGFAVDDLTVGAGLTNRRQGFLARQMDQIDGGFRVFSHTDSALYRQAFGLAGPRVREMLGPKLALGRHLFAQVAD